MNETQDHDLSTGKISALFSRRIYFSTIRLFQLNPRAANTILIRVPGDAEISLMGHTPDTAVGLTGTFNTAPPIERYAGVSFFRRVLGPGSREIDSLVSPVVRKTGLLYCAPKTMVSKADHSAFDSPSSVPQLRHHTLLRASSSRALRFSWIRALKKRQMSGKRFQKQPLPE